MAEICIPKSISNKLREAFASEDISIENLWNMTSEETHQLFENYVGEKNATIVNIEWEKSKLAGFKKAAADYVSASDKAEFAQKTGTAEFAKRLLSDDQKKALAVKAIDSKIKLVQQRQVDISNKLQNAIGESKLNLQLKLDKLQNEETRLNTRKEDLQSPPTDKMLKQIDNLKGLLSPQGEEQFYNDLVASKFGQDVTPAQGKYIVDQATKLQKMAEESKNDSILGATPEYLNARNDLQHYIDNINPEHAGVSILKNIIAIMRNNLITNVSTPLKTFISGSTNHAMGVLIRRVSHLSLGSDNYSLSREIAKENFNTFRKTGMNTAAMESIDDNSSVLGSHIPGKGGVLKDATTNENFESPDTTAGAANKILSGTEKVIGKVAQISHKIAIQLEHNYPFAWVYGKTFSDFINFRASDMAKIEGLTGEAKRARAEELMRDAAKIEPTTDTGKFLRKQGQEAAARVLNVNDTYASRLSLGIKNGLNKIIPGVPIGNLIEPIAKIPANIIANGINNSPLGVPEGIWDVVRGKYNIGAEDLETRYKGMMQYKNGVEHLIRIVGAFGVAALITSQLSKKDFRTDQYGNHFIKVGNTWINTEYLASISPNLAGMMAVKMNPNQNAIKEFLTGNKVGEGAAGGLLHLPGLNEANRSAQSLLGKSPIKDIGVQAQSRVVPAFIQNLFKDRPVDRIFFGATGVESQAQYNKDNKTKATKAAATRKANSKNKK